MRSRYDDPAFQHATTTLPRFGGPTFALHLRLKRLVWMIVWRLLAGWTPPPMRRWRNFSCAVSARACMTPQWCIPRQSCGGPATSSWSVMHLSDPA